MPKIAHLFFLFAYGLSFGGEELLTQGAGTYTVQTATVQFRSDAPLELIRAETDQLQGTLDLAKHTFSFTLDVRSFQGFASGLQRKHFNENYLETQAFPTATFAGKIIDQFDLTVPGSHSLRAKGILEIHGVKQERIIACTVETRDEQCTVQCEFGVMLSEHDIRVPSILHQKIAEEVFVKITADLTRSKL